MIKFGIRWDDESQNHRLIKAKELKLIDFIEVNYPIAEMETPHEVELPIYAHSAYNGLCSAYGINSRLADIINKEANKYNSPWIGEHLAWIAPSNSGALGYVFNPVYNKDFLEITINNINQLKQIYQRPIALELGPQYNLLGENYNEIDFHLKTAKESSCHLILDLTHLIISNHNLNRPNDFGLEKYFEADTIELHIAGIRKSTKDNFWHDSHDILPDENTLKLLNQFIKNNHNLKAITFEHTANATEKEFFEGIESIRNILEK